MLKQILSMFLMAALVGACTPKRPVASSPFIRVENGQFLRGDTPYYYIGANFWYGSVLASEGEGGDRDRLHRELDYLKSIGVDNLRILVGADGGCGVKCKVEPTLQIAPGVYNDTILAGLDYLLAEMGKRQMVAVLYLNNSWEWSGGYGQYLEWTGHGKAAIPAVDGYQAYVEYVRQFQQSDSARTLFANYVNDMITRVNRYTNIKYVDDPAIMSWQICNEPRAFSDENKAAFATWIAQVAAQIKSLDKNHLVSTGSEGKWGCEGDLSLFEQIHADPNIDYINIHIWPYNWGWVSKDSLQEKMGNAKEETKAYLEEHLPVARKYKKPIVIEEFGYPRGEFRFTKESSTDARDAYYSYVFDLVSDKVASDGLIGGCNFWAWGGYAIPSSEHEYWQRGDDYTGDPAQEPQGLYSVFVTDNTVDIIKSACKCLKQNGL